jgi:hypothetical protein
MPFLSSSFFSSPHRAFHRAFDITQYRRDPHTGHISRVRGTDIVPPRSSHRSRLDRDRRPRPIIVDPYSDEEEERYRQRRSARRASYTPNSPRRRYHNAEDRELHEFYLRERARGNQLAYRPREEDYRDGERERSRRYSTGYEREPYADVNVEERYPGQYPRPSTRRGWNTPPPRSPRRYRSPPPSPYRSEPAYDSDRRSVRFASYDERRHEGLYDGAEVRERTPRG